MVDLRTFLLHLLEEGEYIVVLFLACSDTELLVVILSHLRAVFLSHSRALSAVAVGPSIQRQLDLRISLV